MDEENRDCILLLLAYVNDTFGKLHDNYTRANQCKSKTRLSFADGLDVIINEWTDSDFEEEATRFQREFPSCADALQSSFIASVKRSAKKEPSNARIQVSIPPIKALLRPLILHFAREPFLRGGAFFSDGTPPLVKKDCCADALAESFRECAVYVTRVHPVVKEDILWPSDSISNVGVPDEAPHNAPPQHVEHPTRYETGRMDRMDRYDTRDIPNGDADTKVSGASGASRSSRTSAPARGDLDDKGSGIRCSLAGQSAP